MAGDCTGSTRAQSNSLQVVWAGSYGEPVNNVAGPSFCNQHVHVSNYHCACNHSACCWLCTREVPADDPEAALPLHGPNQWPSEDLLPGFRATITAYFDALTALGHKLLRLLALSLKLPGSQTAHVHVQCCLQSLWMYPMHHQQQLCAVLAKQCAATQRVCTVLVTSWWQPLTKVGNAALQW